MSVLSPRRTDETIAIQRRANHSSAAGMGGRREDWRVGAATRRHGADAVSLEKEIRRDAGERSQAVAGARGGESAAQTPRGGPGAQSSSGEGSAGKKVVTAEQRRAAVTEATISAGI